MIVIVNEKSQANWQIVRDDLIGGLRYSWDNLNEVGTWQYSLDTKLFGIDTTSGKYPAHEIIEVIGKDIFVKMIEHIWDKECYRKNDRHEYCLKDLVLFFSWGSVLGDGIDWRTVYDKLVDYSTRKDRDGGN